MTKEKAITLHDSRFWESMSDRDRAMFQMFEERLCMTADPRETVAAVLRECVGAVVCIPPLEDRILAALRKGGHMPEWRPIETAPKDGHFILGYEPTYGAGTMHWQTVTVGGPYADEAVKMTGWRLHGRLIVSGACDQPTRWMPLPPAPPEAEA